jgi:hypothetical protein
MIKKIKQIDVNEVISQYLKIEKDLVWTNYGHQGKQCGIQYKEGDNQWTSAVGKNQGKELEYSNLNSFFKETIFESIIAEYNIKRARLMWSSPYSCYSMHVDTTPRVHIPLITNKDCYFLFRNSFPHHMELGYSYWVDTTKHHTFINCSDTPRLHFIGVVSS